MSAMTKKEWMEYLEKTWDAAQKEAWSEPQFECPRCGHCCRIEEEHMSREAMQQALEALESDPISHAGIVSRKQAITAMRERLAQPEMEPCAGRNCGSTNPNLHSAECFEDYEKSTGMNQWQGLTDKEINSVRHSRDWTAPWTDETFARAIEAKLREKNHG